MMMMMIMIMLIMTIITIIIYLIISVVHRAYLFRLVHKCWPKYASQVSTGIGYLCGNSAVLVFIQSSYAHSAWPSLPGRSNKYWRQFQPPSSKR